MKRRFLLVFLLLLPVSLEAQTINVLPLRVYSDNLPSSKTTKILNMIKEKLAKYKKYKLMNTPKEDPLDLIVDAGFTDLNSESLAGIGKQWQADKVLYTEVKGKKGHYSLYMMLVDVKTKKTKITEIKLPSIEDPESTITTAVLEVFGPLPVPKPKLAKIEIKTTPQGAEVYMQNRYLGKSPITTAYKAGKYTVRVKKPGYKSITKQIELKKGQNLTLNLKLTKIILPVAVPTKARPRATKGKQFYQTWWFWTAVGVVVAGGTTTAIVLATHNWGNPTGSITLTTVPQSADRDVSIISGAGK